MAPQPVETTADQALQAADQWAGSKEKRPRDEGAEFLQDLLATGPVLVTQIKEEVAAAGFSWPTIRRAQKVLGIKPITLGMKGGWTWQLPSKALNSIEDAHLSNVSTFEESEHLRAQPNGNSRPHDDDLDIPGFLDRRNWNA